MWYYRGNWALDFTRLSQYIECVFSNCISIFGWFYSNFSCLKLFSTEVNSHNALLVLTQYFLTWGDFCPHPQKTFGNFWRLFFCCNNLRRYETRLKVGRGQGWLKPYIVQCTGQHPTPTKTSPAQNVSGAIV